MSSQTPTTTEPTSQERKTSPRLAAQKRDLNSGSSCFVATPLLDKLQSTTVPYTDSWTKQGLLEYFVNGWQLNDLLFSSIVDEHSFYSNPDPLRNPLIFYLGHTAAFCINKLKQVGLLEKPINAHFEHIFEIGVDPEKPEDLEKELTAMNWPSVAEVWEYRKQAFELIQDLISRTNILLPIEWDGPLWALLMGMEHDRIHFETSSVLLRQLESGKLKRPDAWHYAPVSAKGGETRMIEVAPGTVTLGKRHEFPTYGWDNEYGALELDIDGFMVSNHMVTNLEFLQFVEDGGYQNKDHWTEASWNWKQQHQIQHPKFWIPSIDGYQYRTLFENIDLPKHWPVEVNHYEAMAYCAWKGEGSRLMSEAEWNLATGDHKVPEQRHDRKNDLMFNNNWNLNLKYGSPHAVGTLESAQNRGIFDLYGNVWEWMSNDFAPLPGFKTHTLYKNFSIPFFDTKHSMILGGSWATTGTGASKFYRLWFRRYFYQHAGFRVAQDLT